MKLKAILFFFSLILGLNSHFSQSNDIQIEFDSPVADTVYSNSIQFTFKITNNGPRTILLGDSLKLWLKINGEQFNLRGEKNRYNILGFSGAVVAGNSVTSQSINFPVDSLTNFNRYNSVCIFLEYLDSTQQDSLMANNTDCYVLKNTTSINEGKELKNYMTIFTKGNELILSSKTKNRSSFALINLQGKVLNRGTFLDNKVLSTHDLPEGMYVVSIMNENQIISKKIVVTHR